MIRFLVKMQTEITGNVSGFLLYAKTEDEVFPDGAPFVIDGNSFGARTLDLNQEFKEIAEQLDDIAKSYFI